MPLLLMAALGLALMAVIISRPYLGLLLVIVSNQFDYFLPMTEGGLLSPGRILGLGVAAGWIIHIGIRGRTNLMLHWRFNSLLVAYLLILAAGVPVSANAQNAFSQLIRVTILVLMAFFVQDLVEDRSKLRTLVWIIAFSYGMSSITGVMQYRSMQAGEHVIGYLSGAGHGIRFSGLQENPNEFALMLMSGVPFLVLVIREAKKWWVRLVHLAVLPMVFFSLSLTASRTHFIAFFAFLITYFVIEMRFKILSAKTLLLFICFCFVVVAVITWVPETTKQRLASVDRHEDEGVEGRWKLFEKSFRLLPDHPFFGVGLYNFANHRPLLGEDAHDMFSVAVAETGIAGSVIFAAILIATFRRHRANIARFRELNDQYLGRVATICQAAFVTFIVTGAGNIIIYQRMFWMYVAFAVLLSKGAQNLGERRGSLASTHIRYLGVSIRQRQPKNRVGVGRDV